MLILQRAVFLHVPKTGGTWVEQALRMAGVEFEQFIVDGDQHGDLSYSPRPQAFTIAFVRNPLTLYQSYWRFKVDRGWDQRNPFDVECRADSFIDFVAGVVRQHPGWCSQMFEDYVGPPTAPISFIGRFENLADDLVTALRLCGEQFDEAALRSTPPANVSRTPLTLCQWRQDLITTVAKSEVSAMTRFGYASGVD